jgi:hypothetical protein
MPGHLEGVTVATIDNIFSRVLLRSPADSLQTFTCRTWFIEAVNKLAEAGIVSCCDVGELEKELKKFAEENDDNAVTGGRYTYKESAYCS